MSHLILTLRSLSLTHALTSYLYSEVEKKQKLLEEECNEKLEVLRNLENQRQSLEDEKYSADVELGNCIE